MHSGPSVWVVRVGGDDGEPRPFHYIYERRRGRWGTPTITRIIRMVDNLAWEKAWEKEVERAHSLEHQARFGTFAGDKTKGCHQQPEVEPIYPFQPSVDFP